MPRGNLMVDDRDPPPLGLGRACAARRTRPCLTELERAVDLSPN
jgi:hypothetical protein